MIVSHLGFYNMSAPYASRCYSCASLWAASCTGVKHQRDNLVKLPLYLLSCRHFIYCPVFLLTMVIADCPQTAILCTGRVLSSVCRDGELWVWICGWYGCWTAGHCTLHQHTAGWERKLTCYSKSRLSAFGRNWRKPLKSVLRCCCRAFALTRHDYCWMKPWCNRGSRLSHLSSNQEKRLETEAEAQRRHRLHEACLLRLAFA